VGVAPVLLPVFGGLPLVALPANLAVAPAAAALTVWGLGSGLAGGLLSSWWPVAAGLLQAPTGTLAGYIAGVAAVAGRFPLAVTPGQAKTAAVMGAAAFALRCARGGRRSRSGAHREPVRTAADGRAQTGPGR
jgi:competence protein ComEC